MDPPPQFVLETGLYARDLDAAEEFYKEVMGLGVLFRDEGRHVFFRCGTGVVLVFNPEATREGDTLPSHGTTGAGHVAFAVETDRLASWKEWFHQKGIPIEHEETWGEGAHSFYVRDPAGNSVELASANLWGTASPGDRLQQLRPQLDVDVSHSGPLEAFQHQSLRPILKLLNSTLLHLVVEQLVRYGGGFAEKNRSDQRDRLRALIKEDSRLKQMLFGMVAAHLTEDELAFYFDHESEIRRRCVSMLLARVQDQVDEIATRAFERQGE